MGLIFIILVILAVPLEAWHDYHKATYAWGFDPTQIDWNWYEARISKRFKWLMLFIVWGIGLYFDQTRTITLVHIGTRCLFFDYLYEVFRYKATYGWKVIYKAWVIALKNNELIKQFKSFN